MSSSFDDDFERLGKWAAMSVIGVVVVFAVFVVFMAGDRMRIFVEGWACAWI